MAIYIVTVLAECISEQKFASTQYRLSECTPYLKQIAAPFVSLSYSDKETRWPLSNNKQLQEFLRKVLAQPDYARRIKKYEGYVIRFRDEYTGIEDGALDVSMFTEVDVSKAKAPNFGSFSRHECISLGLVIFQTTSTKTPLPVIFT